MSICSLNSLHFKICRQALFLTKSNLFIPIAIVKPNFATDSKSLDNAIRKRALQTSNTNFRNQADAGKCQALKGKSSSSSSSSSASSSSSSGKGKECNPLSMRAPRCTPPKVCEGINPPKKDHTWTYIGAMLVAAGLGGFVYLLLHKEKKKPVPMPVHSSDIPRHVPYLLIGGGTAGFSAFRAIKSNDPKAKVLMVTSEPRKPYMRPPLSKELWYTAKQGPLTKDLRFKQWTGAERSLYFEPDEFYIHPKNLMESENGGIAVADGFTIKTIDPVAQTATLVEDGVEIKYDKCLIATGCTPKNLAIFEDAPASVKDRVTVFRTPADFEKIKNFADTKNSITIIGNGFLGSELACSLANYSQKRQIEINQIFPESGNMSKILPDYLRKWTMKRLEALGVCVIPNTLVKECKRDEDKVKLTLSNGKIVLTDCVIVCIGSRPNTDFGCGSGLEIDSNLGGFVVNAELEARSNLFVAGDASNFYDPLLGRRRVEHHDHSVVSGRLAGENMVGKKKPYKHQSMFWSDLGPEIGYEGIGLVDSSLPTVGIFALQSKADRQTNNLDGTSPDAKVIDLNKPISGEGGGGGGGGSGGGGDKTKSKTDDSSSQGQQERQTSWEDFGKGVIFYMKDEKIAGILLWNIFNRIGVARAIINENKKFDDLNELAKLFEIHS